MKKYYIETYHPALASKTEFRFHKTFDKESLNPCLSCLFEVNAQTKNEAIAKVMDFVAGWRDGDVKLLIGEKETKKENKDVHTEHCCSICGCKYGDKGCSVMLGKKQSYEHGEQGICCNY